MRDLTQDEQRIVDVAQSLSDSAPWAEEDNDTWHAESRDARILHALSRESTELLGEMHPLAYALRDVVYESWGEDT